MMERRRYVRPTLLVMRLVLVLVGGQADAAFGSSLPFSLEVLEPTNAAIEYYDPAVDSLSLDLRDNQDRSDTNLIVVKEQTSFELFSYVEVNLLASTRHSGYLRPGTVVNDFLLHFDPERDRLDGTRLHVRLRFDRPVLGLITKNRVLKDSDAVFGLDAGEVRLQPQKARGIDGNDSTVVLSPDAHTVGIDLLVTDYYDQMRILLPAAADPLLLGDFNYDGTVNAADYVVWRDTLGQLGAGLAADGDGSGVIDEADYGVWKTNFGATASAALADPHHAGVPEPATALLMIMASVAACVRCRRTA